VTTQQNKTDVVTLVSDIVVLLFSFNQIQVLLIQRKKDPFSGYWALPGGKLNREETIEQCASRELKEETGIDELITPIHLIGVYSDPDRDNRGRFVSCAYLLQLFQAPGAYAPTVQAGDDAARAQFFPVDHLPMLAFDHSRIILEAVQKSRL
jgi:8-oxo-dGTP diphosphatase